MNAEAFIDFAGLLAARDHQPAACRSAVSRSYYGAFHIAKAFLEAIGVTPPRSDNVHIFVQRRLANCGIDTATEIGRLLSDLHRERINADYVLSRERTERVLVARECVELANLVQQHLIACRNKETRLAIHAGIQSYENRISGKT